MRDYPMSAADLQHMIDTSRRAPSGSIRYEHFTNEPRAGELSQVSVILEVDTRNDRVKVVREELFYDQTYEMGGWYLRTETSELADLSYTDFTASEWFDEAMDAFSDGEPRLPDTGLSVFEDKNKGCVDITVRTLRCARDNDHTKLGGVDERSMAVYDDGTICLLDDRGYSVAEVTWDEIVEALEVKKLLSRAGVEVERDRIIVPYAHQD